MLRASPLNDQRVIRLISENCIPVALNLYIIRVQKDAAGDFFRAVQKQRQQYQGLYLVTPQGKVLAGHHDYKSEKTWADDLLADLQPGLKAFGAIKPRKIERVDPLPHRGVGIQPDKGVTLAIYLRHGIKGVPLREVPNPTIDSLALTAMELAELTSPKLVVGHEWALSEELSRKFSRVLGPTDENSMPRPSEVKAVRFTGRVWHVDGNIVYFKYSGSLNGAHLTHDKKLTHGEATLTGVGRFDTKKAEMISLLWVFDGIYRAPPPHDRPGRYNAVVEWRNK